MWSTVEIPLNVQKQNVRVISLNILNLSVVSKYIETRELYGESFKQTFYFTMITEQDWARLTEQMHTAVCTTKLSNYFS